MKFASRLRRHLSPLSGDTVSTLDLPPVRMGLLTKLNVLTVGLIFLTAAALSILHFAQQWRDDKQELRSQGATLLGVIAQLAEHGIVTLGQGLSRADAGQRGQQSRCRLRQRVRRQARGAGGASLRGRTRQGDSCRPSTRSQVPLAPGRIADRDVTIGASVTSNSSRPSRSRAPWRAEVAPQTGATGEPDRLPAPRHDPGRAAPRVSRADGRRRRRGAGAAHRSPSSPRCC